jgi:pSer/pThr/pTyr-binding forkhead associated (FHA) protein
MPTAPPVTPPARPAKVSSGRPAEPYRPEADGARTIGIGQGVLPAVAGKVLVIQFFDGLGHWHDLEPLKGIEHVVGRGSFGRGMPAPDFLAEEHLRITREGPVLYVEEGDSVNGAYLKVAPGRPVELVPGARFQVGHHVIELRVPDRPDPVEPLVSPDGEVFRSRPLAPLAFLDFIGPDNSPCLSFPLTKPEGTVIGREGDYCDVALTGDEWASRSHARVARRDDRYFLEDLQSKNGTFVRVTGRTRLRHATAQSPEGGDLVLIGALLLRVIEK